MRAIIALRRNADFVSRLIQKHEPPQDSNLVRLKNSEVQRQGSEPVRGSFLMLKQRRDVINADNMFFGIFHLLELSVAFVLRNRLQY